MAAARTARIARSYLYLPGDRPDFLAKALGRGADALILDLEDGVAPGAKELARNTIRAFLDGRRDPAGQPSAIWVRVNGDGQAADDIEAVASPALTGYCLAKAETVEDVREASDACAWAEGTLGLAPGSLALQPVLESATAIMDARQLAASSPRVTTLQIGEADLCAELGLAPTAGCQELLLVRSAVVLASAAAGLDPPVGPVATGFRDLDAFRASTCALARLGFRSRACIHPAQVAVVNEVFTPSAEELARARKDVERFEAALAAGKGTFVGEHGQMVDAATIRHARRILATAAPPRGPAQEA